MVIEIGNTTLPGVSGSMESVPSVRVNTPSPADIGLVGEGDVVSGEAEAATAYSIRTPGDAYRLFGRESELSEAIVDALGSGANPVYAASAGAVEVTGEDVSGQTEAGALAESPVAKLGTVTFTVDGTAKTVIYTHLDPTTISPSSDEVYLNPVTGEYHVDVAPSTSATVDYHYLSYGGAITALEDEYAEQVDFVVPLTENADVKGEAVSMVHRLLDIGEFGVVLAGHASYVDFSGTPEADYDDSRVVEVYPTRNKDGDSILGGYAGVRAALGVDSSPMQKRIPMVGPLSETLTDAQKAALVAGRIVPIQNASSAPLVRDDLTTVSDTNLDESDWTDSLSRLITDYVTEQVMDVSEPFVGGLHDNDTRLHLQGIIRSRLDVLTDARSLVAFEVAVLPSDAYTAEVHVAIETVKPLRNIVVKVTSGEIEQASA